MTQTQLTISGMTCDHCVRHVTDAISNVAGVNSVKVSLADGIATIDSDLGFDLQLVKTAVVDAGYVA